MFAGLDERLYGFLDTSLHANVEAAYHALAIDERRRPFVPTLWTTFAPGQEVEQVWFAGVHGDVGGGYAETGLSDITLGWMIAKASAKGLVFDAAALARYVPPQAAHALDRMHDSWSPLWGFPRIRAIPAGAAISNSAALRREHRPDYRPPNLPAAFPADPGGFAIAAVVTPPPDWAGAARGRGGRVFAPPGVCTSARRAS